MNHSSYLGRSDTHTHLKAVLHLLYQAVDTLGGAVGGVGEGEASGGRDFLHCHALDRQLQLPLTVGVVGCDALP